MDRQTDIRTLLRTHSRYLQVLKEQLAMYGRAEVPPRIILEIEDTEAEIERLQAELDAFENDPDTLPQRIEQQRRRIAEGLDELRQQASATPAIEQRQIRVVGRPPLGTVEHFKDRLREREKIGELLAEPSTRLVSVIGHGGMGKTALASKILRDLEQHRWPHTDDNIPLDGIVYLSTRTAGISLERLFLDCAKLFDGETGQQLNAIWTNPKLSTGDKVIRLLDLLNNGRYVILLDNMEDLLDDAGRLTDEDLRLFFDQSLTQAHGVRLLVTSRLSLTFQREVMRFDQQVKLLDGLPEADGVALLRELDPNGDYGLRDAGVEELAQAVRLVHGVPRALEVLAGILANDPFATLTEVMAQFYEQEDVAQALIEENYKRLDSNARRVIEALAVFKRPVPSLAVDYLLEPFVPGLDVPGILRRLTHTNIISIDRAAKTVTLHPIDQDYAYSQLPEEGNYSRPALERRAADYYVQLRKPEEEWKTIDDLAPQLAEFEHRVRAGNFNNACRLLGSIDQEYLFLWSHYTRLTQMRNILMAHVTDSCLQMDNFGGLGRCYYFQGHFERAMELYEQALNIARKIGNRREESIYLGHLGTAYRTLGQIKFAIKSYEDVLTIARALGDHQMVGHSLGRLAIAYRDLGQFTRAIGFYEQALITAQEVGNLHQEGLWLGLMGIVYFDLGQLQRTINLQEQALTIARNIGDRRGESMWLSNLRKAHFAVGHLDQAIEFQKEALIISREIDDRRSKSVQSLFLSKIFQAKGNLWQARQLCSEALELEAAEVHYRAALTLGIIILQQGEPVARDIFADAVTRCRALLDKTAGLFQPRYALATALVGQAISKPEWSTETKRPNLLSPALTEYQRALEITAALGVVQNAIRDLELIRSAGIEGLEPVFDLLEKALAKNDE